MDDSGNILVKRIAKSNVYVKNTTEENSIANDILKVPNGALEQDKPCNVNINAHWLVMRGNAEGDTAEPNLFMIPITAECFSAVPRTNVYIPAKVGAKTNQPENNVPKCECPEYFLRKRLHRCFTKSHENFAKVEEF